MVVRDKERFDAGKWKPVAFPLFIQNDASFSWGFIVVFAVHARSFRDEFRFSLFLSLHFETVPSDRESQEPGWSWQIRQQNERDVSERCPARMRYANCIIARAA